MADLQLAETLFTAMDEIIHKRIEDLPYDKTILATIEDNKNAKKGEYVVNDGMTTFKAFSSNTEYSNGDRVYVSIPQGDYDQQKNIIGRYTLEGTNQTPLNYRDPLSYLVDITGNLYLNSNDYFTLIANGELEHTGILWSWSASEEEENPFTGFDMISISAGFQSSVGRNQIVIDGNYGLLLTITSKVNDTNLVSYQFNLDSNEFFGDPYNFETYYTQSKVFKLKDYGIERIDAMNLMFYQKGNFINQDYEKISSDIIGYNLAVSNIDIRAGYDIANFQDKDDTIIIYTNESKTYWNVVPNTIKSKYPERNIDLMSTQELANFLDEVNHKTILCRWIHKESENNYICYDGINNALPETAQIKWYRYKYEELQDREDIPDTDPPGRFWEEEPYRNSFILGLDPKITKHTEKIKAVVWNPSQDYVENQINNNNTYVEQERYTQASLNVLAIFNPFYAFKKFFTDEYYKAFFRWQGGKKAKDAFLNSNAVNLTYLNNNEGYKTINNIYEKLLASSNNEDIYRVCAIIKGQLEYLRDFLNNSYYSYFIASSNWGGLSTQEKVKKESELLYKFYQKNYVQLDNIDVLLRYPDPTPQDVNHYRNDYDKYYLSMWQVFLNNQQIGDHDERVHILDNSDGFKVYQDTLTEINRLITNCEDKNYDAIKSYIQNIENKVNEKETEMLTKFNTMDPDVVTERNVSLEEWKYTYSQILNYKVFDQVYNNNEKERDALSTSLKAEAKYFLSNELEFMNEDPSVWEEFDTIKDLTLEVDKINTSGIYKLYTPEGRLEDDDDALIQRIITAKYTNIYTGNTDIDTAEEIIWKIPRQNTMIQTPQENVEYTKFDQVSIDSVPNAITFPNGTYYVWDTTTNNYIIATSFNENATYYVPNNVEFIDEDITNPYYDENNYVIVRKMPLSRNTQYGVEEANAVSIKFRIKSTLLKEYTNNTITCIVKRNGRPVIAETTLLFGEKDLSGSDYNFYLALKNNKQFIVYGEDSVVDIDVKLLNEQGEQIDITSTITFGWYSQYGSGGGLSVNSSTGRITLNNSVTIDKFAHYILQASINTDVKVGTLTSRMTLKAYLPIIVVAKDVLYNNQGPFKILKYHGRSTISYDNNGINPSYYQDPLNVYLWDHINKRTLEVENTVWSTIHTANCERGGVFKSQYFPMITEDHKIIAPSIYMNDSTNNETITVICKYNNQIIFMMPLFIYLKVYNSTAINQWNGNLTLDHDNGIILSKMMGAGYKGSDNSFYGVLMGDLGEDDDVTASNEYSNLYDYFYGTGLYGFNKGQKSFGFNINGYGFIGKVGRGQILFDGNNGVIKSSLYNIDQPGVSEGMMIDIDDGIIDIWGPRNGQKKVPVRIKIDSTGTYNGVDAYFYIQGKKLEADGETVSLNPETGQELSTYLMWIGQNDYILKSANYNNWNDNTIQNNPELCQGTVFDLKHGILRAAKARFSGSIYGTTISGGTISGTTITGSKIVAGDVSSGAGVLIEKNGNITMRGTLYATAGNIGPWSINNTVNGGLEYGSKVYLCPNGNKQFTAKQLQNGIWKSETKNNGAFFLNGNFIVDTNGTLYAKNLYIDNSAGGYISGATLEGSTIKQVDIQNFLYFEITSQTFGNDKFIWKNGSNTLTINKADITFGMKGDLYSHVNSSTSYDPDDFDHIENTWKIENDLSTPPSLEQIDSDPIGINVKFWNDTEGLAKYEDNHEIFRVLTIKGRNIHFRNYATSFFSYVGMNQGLGVRGGIQCTGTVRCNMLRIGNPGHADSKTANCRLTAGSDTDENNGWVRYVGSSSIRYKNVLRELTNQDIKNLFNIPVYYFKYKKDYLAKDDERYDKAIPGFIAEEIDKIISIAVDHNEKDNSCEMWNSNIIVPLMFQMIKNNHEEIQELQQQIKELKEKIK